MVLIEKNQSHNLYQVGYKDGYDDGKNAQTEAYKAGYEAAITDVILSVEVMPDRTQKIANYIFNNINAINSLQCELLDKMNLFDGVMNSYFKYVKAEIQVDIQATRYKGTHRTEEAGEDSERGTSLPAGASTLI